MPHPNGKKPMVKKTKTRKMTHGSAVSALAKSGAGGKAVSAYASSKKKKKA